MLFKHKHLLEELRARGVQGTGQILSIKTVGSDGSMRDGWSSDADLTTEWTDVHLQLRVMPANRGEAPFEANVMTRLHTMKWAGGSVPVWFDPADHSQVVVDYEADAQTAMHYAADSDRLMHRTEQRLALAWTPVGNELLPIEVLITKGTGPKGAGQLILPRGPIGDLLREPTYAAATYVRREAGQLVQLDDAWFAHHDIHVRQAWGDFPRSATIDDSPSCALAVAAALCSTLSGRMVRPEVAVMGEIAPDGSLLPVRGFKERVHAAKGDYAQKVVAPAGNEADLHEVSQKQRQGIEFAFVATAAEGLKACLTRHPVKGFVLPA